MKRVALLTTAVLGLVLLVLYGCHDAADVTEPSAVITTVTYTLTVSGSGTGSGVVKSTPLGITCTITDGHAASTGCTKAFTQGQTVTLTATPANGTAFGGWLNVLVCRSLGTCTFKMTANRTVSAVFRKGPFTVRITSGSQGPGTGRVTSQSGLTPALNCLITNGTPATTGCSASYPANTVLTLRAAANSGSVFNGWGLPTCGTGACQLSLIQGVTIPASFAVATSSSPAVQGKWDPAFTTPSVLVHAHLLRTGKALVWGDNGSAFLWSATSGFTTVIKPYRIYCTGHTFLPDGRLLIMGGTSAGTAGLRSASIFNPSTSTWAATESMSRGRYYPTATTLPNGEVLVVSGHDANKVVVRAPEIWSGGGWRKLPDTSVAIGQPYYPPMFVAPNGKVFMAGFAQSRYLDVAAGRWGPIINRLVARRDMGSAVMYAPGKILYAGGGDSTQVPTAAAEKIDLSQSSPAWTTAGTMKFPRRQMNATLLADGSVLVTGGTSGAGFNNQAGAVRDAELWNPATGTWTTMARESQTRTYHSTALLLPSGRVLSSGGGEGGGITLANSEFTAQVYSPPYLFNADGSAAARPSIGSAPATLHYNQIFTVETPNAASVSRGTLIRLSSVTHAFNQSQLVYHLTFTRPAGTTTTLSARAPAGGNLAPPGPYMLFLINGSGVPSFAKMVTVGP
jgi:galactose oxidase-like protein/glyoxal oxidase-like protein/List-Bact-rpt repeat protein